MKNFILALPLMLASCASVSPGNVPIEHDGPVARTIERVLVRVEGYMASEAPPVEIPVEMREQVEAAILTARTMVSRPEVSGSLLLVTMSGVMDLHDALVSLDAALDQLERDIYLEDTARLRSLFESVDIYADDAEPALAK